MIYAVCVCNEGFEDQLRLGKLYEVKPQGGSYLVDGRWYGRSKFELA